MVEKGEIYVCVLWMGVRKRRARDRKMFYPEDYVWGQKVATAPGEKNGMG